jgi:hypothetical protein
VRFRIQGDDFAGSSSSVVEQQQQGLVADAGARSEIDRIEQRLHLVFLEVVDLAVLGALAGNGANLVAGEHPGGLLSGDEAKQRPHGRESGIAGLGGASPSGFEMIEERQNERFIDVRDAQLVDAFVARVGRIAQQQLDGVSVGGDRVGREAFLQREIVAEEAVEERSEQIGHGFSPWGWTWWRK